MDRLTQQGLRERMAELFDLPADLVAGLFHLELLGDKQLLVEGHEGILSYSQQSIDINVRGNVLRVRGTGLVLRAMTEQVLRIGGKIDAVELVR